MIILVGQLRPYKLPMDNYLDMANEFAICILIYHLMCLTDFVLDPPTRFKIGYSIIALVCLLLVCNLGLIFKASIAKSVRRYQLKQEKAENIKYFLNQQRINAYREKVRLQNLEEERAAALALEEEKKAEDSDSEDDSEDDNEDSEEESEEESESDVSDRAEERKAAALDRQEERKAAALARN